MFFRVKRTRGVDYLQLVANERRGPSVQQRVLASLGRLEDLRLSGELRRLVDAGALLSGDGMLLVPPFSDVELELVPDATLERKLLDALAASPRTGAVLESFCRGDPQGLRALVGMVTFGHLADVGGQDGHLDHLLRLGRQDAGVLREAANIMALARAYANDSEGGELVLAVRVAANRVSLLRGLVTCLVTTASGAPIAAGLWSAHLPPIKTIVDVAAHLGRRLEAGAVTLVLDQSSSGGAVLSALSKLNLPFVIPIRQGMSRAGRRGLAGLVCNDVQPPPRPPGERGAGPETQLRYVQIVDAVAAERDWRLRTTQLDRLQSTIEATGGPAAGPAFARLDQARRELLEAERWDGTVVLATNLTAPPQDVARIYFANDEVRDWEDELAEFGQKVMQLDISTRDTGAMLAGGAAVLLMAKYLRHQLLDGFGQALNRPLEWAEFRSIVGKHRSVRISQGGRAVTLAPEAPPALQALLDTLALPPDPPRIERRAFRRARQPELPQ